MSPCLKSDTIHLDHSGSSAKDKHRLQELPEPRGLACLACRRKKHLCDRKKPSCTSCLNVDMDCVYADRKSRLTVADLEDEVQRLERKYETCLKAAGVDAKARISSATVSPSHQYVKESSTPESMSSIASSMDGRRLFDNRRSSPPNTDPPFGGYHFDESFLVMPTYTLSASHRPPDPSPRLGHHFTSHPTRVFTPVSRIPRTHRSPFTDRSIEVIDSSRIAEQKRTDVRPAKRQRLYSPLGYAFDQPRAKTGGSYVTHQEASATSHLPRERSPTSPSTDISQAPTLHFSRATWWDCLLGTYSRWPDSPHDITPRHDVTTEISRDVYLFFQAAPVWFSFLHVPLFFDNFCHPERRADIQPALVLSILAYTKLVQSNHDVKDDQSLEERERSWRQSVVLRDLAQASFEASYNAGWLDLPLAQAACILALYEMCPHRDCTSYRMQSSASLLDNIIRAMGLTFIDALDPRAPTYASDAVPALGRPRPNRTTDYSLQLSSSGTATELTIQSPIPVSSEPLSLSRSVRWQEASTNEPFDLWQIPPTLRHDHDGRPKVPARCPCQSLSLSETPELLRSTPSWSLIPGWAQDARAGEIKKEVARRLVWNSVIMLGCDASARRAAGLPQLDLYISKPENLAILFPGEDNYSSLQNVDEGHSGKE
ncbi:hypothetical protein FRB96_008899 [Tulasnella sp. 330]|nr:hypothetical protein FRB96_008899 [Tulasnella sp. 330]